MRSFVPFDEFELECVPENKPLAQTTQEYRPAGDRYSFRMDELCLFIARGMEERIAALEATVSKEE